MNINELDIVPYPHPALRWISKPVSDITSLVKDVAHKMISLMHEYKGIGLAAPQIAIPWRIFVTCATGKDMVFINPTITLSNSGKRLFVTDIPEGCLSIPGLNINYPIRRNLNIEVNAFDLDGKLFTVSSTELKKDNCLLARCILHEVDHLNGVLFVDYIPKDAQDEETQALRKHVDGWLQYMKTQYDFLPSHGKLALNKYESDEKEADKLLALEQLMSGIVV